MELKLEYPRAETLLLYIAGRFDTTTVDQVKASWSVNDTLRFIVVDLSETTFIDSMGLAALISGVKKARQRGGRLLLANPAEPVTILLELTAMNQALDIFSTIAEALVEIDNLT